MLSLHLDPRRGLRANEVAEVVVPLGVVGLVGAEVAVGGGTLVPPPPGVEAAPTSLAPVTHTLHT